MREYKEKEHPTSFEPYKGSDERKYFDTAGSFDAVSENKVG